MPFPMQIYHDRYVFPKASGHVDGSVAGQTLPEALRRLWRGYPLKIAFSK